MNDYKILLKKIHNNNIILLKGKMGAGKTQFFREFLRYLKVNQNVTSPTFSIKNEYKYGDKIISHYDLYRDNLSKKLIRNFINEDLENENIIFIEWPEKYKKIFLFKHILISININPDESREVTIEEFSEKK